MTDLRFYGKPPPGTSTDPLPGRLVVIEGVDGVGRSTQIALLSEWLELRGHAVLTSGLTRSRLAGRGIERAKEGNTLDPLTLNLFYATDFCDRLEREIIPALRAGAVALVDRYFYSIMARAIVRGLAPEWLQNLYGFAPVPDKTIYLDIDVDSLIPRVLSNKGFDYWESGQDFLRNPELFQNFVQYKKLFLSEFQILARDHNMTVVDARGSIAEVFSEIRGELEVILKDMTAKSAQALQKSVS